MLPRLLAASAALVTVLAPARPAEACSPQSHVDHIVPGEGQTHPANAAFVLFGAFYEDFNVSVLVDGIPAAVVKVPELSGSTGPYSDTLAFTIAPQPGSGQSVTLTYCEPPDCVVDVMHTFMTGPADNTAPELVAELSFDVHEHGQTAPGTGACVGPRDTGYWVRFAAPPPGAAPVLYRVSGSQLPGGEAASGFDRLAEGAEGEMTVEFRRQETIILEPASACVRVQAIDYALNAGEELEVCGACRLRQDEAGAGGEEPPAEPGWTAADDAPGGPCDDSPGETETDTGETGGIETDTGATGTTAGTGAGTDPPFDLGTETGGQDEEGGCGCRGSGGPAPAALALLVLFGIRRRREV